MLIALCALTAAWAGSLGSVRMEASLLWPNLGQSDPTLQAYGFDPIGQPLLPTFGVRGDVALGERWRVGLVASSGFLGGSSQTAAPASTTSSTRLAAHVERVLGPAALRVELGFATLVHAVSSEIQGGALRYLGPALRPALTWRPLDELSVLELGLGWQLSTPVGPAHDQPLWEEDFRRQLIHGPILSFGSGLGVPGS